MSMNRRDFFRKAAAGLLAGAAMVYCPKALEPPKVEYIRPCRVRYIFERDEDGRFLGGFSAEVGEWTNYDPKA